MKSYIEPMNAADALDVLDLYGVDTPGAWTVAGEPASVAAAAKAAARRSDSDGKAHVGAKL